MTTLVRRGLSREARRLADTLDRRALRQRSFTIISNDCWGADVYRALGLPYQTPFVGMAIYGPCFIALLRDLRALLDQPLCFTSETRYEECALRREAKRWYFPIATLGGEVELHFGHARSPEEAADKWYRRLQRIDWDNLYFKFADGKDDITAEHVAEFDQLPYERKVALVSRPYPNLTSTVCIRRYEQDAGKMYRLAQPEFDVVSWLNNADGKVAGLRSRVRRYRTA
jgi:uncharacterized protein (DUF1919 family)